MGSGSSSQSGDNNFHLLADHNFNLLDDDNSSTCGYTAIESQVVMRLETQSCRLDICIRNKIPG